MKVITAENIIAYVYPHDPANKRDRHTETILTDAGIDPTIIEDAIRLALNKASPTQELQLAAMPEIGMVLGAAFAAAYIALK